MQLKSGRTVCFRPMPNGAQDAYMVPGAEAMTNSEWREFADRFPAWDKARKAEARVAKNRAAWEADKARRMASDSQLATHA